MKYNWSKFAVSWFVSFIIIMFFSRCVFAEEITENTASAQVTYNVQPSWSINIPSVVYANDSMSQISITASDIHIGDKQVVYVDIAEGSFTTDEFGNTIIELTSFDGYSKIPCYVNGYASISTAEGNHNGNYNIAKFTANQMMPTSGGTVTLNPQVPAFAPTGDYAGTLMFSISHEYIP